MKFNITKTSDWRFHEVRDFQSLEELMKFVNDNGCEAVLSVDNFGHYNNDYPTFEIYDDYRE